MKHIVLTIIAIASIINVPFAYAATIDANADIKAEFKNDLPKSYTEAIKNVTTLGVTTSAQATPESELGTGPAEFSFTQSDQDQVRVVYTGHAQLFGFLAVPVDIEVAIDADGKARVALPWYRFALTHEDTASVEDTLSAIVQSKTKLPAPNGILSENDQTIIMMILKDTLPFHFTN